MSHSTLGGGLRGMAAGVLWVSLLTLRAETDVYLLEVPDYDWQYGCFGTACGNLFGFWDRNGLPGFYSGPTAGGIAPLDSREANAGIRSMWASQAGFDGRPDDKPGHVDDYWKYYESTAADPYATAGRTEHAPDCVGDFIGLNQKKWTDMNGECDGNIDGFSFVYWDQAGDRRLNHQPTNTLGEPVPDIQSGLGGWTRFRGYEAEVFSQLADFNPTVQPGKGFTFDDLKGEIDAGYPVLLFLQEPQNSRSIGGMPRANPDLHGMLAYGYGIGESGEQIVRYRTSWGDGGNYKPWSGTPWEAFLPLRGVIGYHPKPKITKLEPNASSLMISWAGPSARLYDAVSGVTHAVHRYVVETSATLPPTDFYPVTGTNTAQQATVSFCACSPAAFFRVRLVSP